MKVNSLDDPAFTYGVGRLFWQTVWALADVLSVEHTIWSEALVVSMPSRGYGLRLNAGEP